MILNNESLRLFNTKSTALCPSRVLIVKPALSRPLAGLTGLDNSRATGSVESGFFFCAVFVLGVCVVLAVLPVVRRFGVVRSFGSCFGVSSFWVAFVVPVLGVVVFRFPSRRAVAAFLWRLRVAVRWWRSVPRRFPSPGGGWVLSSRWSVGGGSFASLPRFGLRWLLGWSRFVVVFCPWGRRSRASVLRCFCSPPVVCSR